jgi:hypothetical protein
VVPHHNKRTVFEGENSLFDIVLKSASLFDPAKFFLPNLTSKVHFLPKMTLLLETLGPSVIFSFTGPKHPSLFEPETMNHH